MTTTSNLGALALCLAFAGTSLAATIQAPDTDPLQDAFDHLYDAAGLPRHAVDPPDVPGLAALVEAVADAADATHRTLADLEDPDRFWALLLDRDLPDATHTEADLAWLHEQLLRVDLDALNDAVQAIRDAAEGIPSDLSLEVAADWTDPSGIVVVGDAGSTCAPAHTVERVLIVDLGGDDCYDNHAATATPWDIIPLPVSVIVETGGNDRYVTSARHPGHPDAAFGQAVGVGGIGLIIDRWGDDLYSTTLGPQQPSCEPHLQRVYAQAVGVLGVGAIVDGSGDDRYTATNVHLAGGCAQNVAYTFAQAVGLNLGVGLLLDDTGHDDYHAHAHVRDGSEGFAQTVAQAASSSGVAALVDKEGDDDYFAGALNDHPATAAVGDKHAHVFAQGSNLRTDLEPRQFAWGACLAEPEQLGPAVLPVLDALGDCSPCPSFLPTLALSCAPGAAALVDLLGSDDYVLDADALTGSCRDVARAVAMGQGGSAWTGAGVLVDADGGERNLFLAGADALSESCTAQAHLYVQGFAGGIRYDDFDPQFQSNAEHAAQGLLLSLGPMEPDRCPVAPQFIDIPPAPPQAIAVACSPLFRTGVFDSQDVYDAHANADSAVLAEAHAYAQGVASNKADLPFAPVGVLADAAGNDFRNLVAEARGPVLRTDAWGQGAGMGGAGVLTDVGGNDSYLAYAFQNGVSVPSDTHVQAYSGGSIPLVPVTLCPIPLPDSACIRTPESLLGVGILVDVFGYDRYSEAVERPGCHVNGETLGNWPTGLGGQPTVLGPGLWGTILSWPCNPLPIATTGNSISIGADLESDLNVW